MSIYFKYNVQACDQDGNNCNEYTATTGTQNGVDIQTVNISSQPYYYGKLKNKCDSSTNSNCNVYTGQIKYKISDNNFIACTKSGSSLFTWGDSNNNIKLGYSSQTKKCSGSTYV